jgi:hypothetical protein
MYKDKAQIKSRLEQLISCYAAAVFTGMWKAQHDRMTAARSKTLPSLLHAAAHLAAGPRTHCE